MQTKLNLGNYTETGEAMDVAAEYQDWENKKSLSEERAAIETIAAFATSQGGTVRLGIAPEGTVSGVQLGKNTMENLANSIKEHTEPPQFPSISIEGAESSCVVSIKVEESPLKPVFAYNIPYKRVGRTNQKIGRDECHRLMYQTRRQSWDALGYNELTVEDLDAQLLRLFMHRASLQRGMSPSAMLGTLGLLAGNTVAHAAILLFTASPEQFIANAFVQCARFEGTTSATFLDEQTVYGDIITQIESAVAFVRRNTRQAIRITGNPQHERVPEYPEEAVREAINNAVCHRDYRAVGSVQIRIYDDRLEVWNPGLLPPELEINDLYKEHSSHPRNPLLAEALHRARVIEHWGTGTIRILQACESSGMPRPEFAVEQGTFKVRFAGLGQRLFLDLSGLPERQRRAVAHIQEHSRITTQEYSHLVRVSERTARNDLNEMTKRNILERRGRSSDTHFVLCLSSEPSANLRQSSAK